MTLLRREDAGARVVEDDPFVPVGDDEVLPPSGDVMVSLARFEREAPALRERAGRLAVRVPGETDPDALAPTLEGVSLIAVEFPKFTDGRGYSLARVLRDRGGYEGELRALGHVLRDQLFYMARCGFDSFALADGQDVQDALAAFADFSVTYQPAADHDQPIWRRRRP